MKIVGAKSFWFGVLKDVGKFYLYMACFFAVGAVLVFLYAQLIVGSFYDFIGVLDFDTVMSEYLWLIEVTRYVLIFLSCWGVFFSLPPKAMMHCFAVVITMSLPLYFVFWDVRYAAECFILLMVFMVVIRIVAFVLWRFRSNVTLMR